MIPAELRGALLGLDEDEGANALSTDGYSRYHSLQTSLQKRFSHGYMFNASYTFSRSIDTFSDEGLYQVQNDPTRPELNRRAVGLQSRAPDDRQLVVGAAVPRQPLGGGLAAVGHRHHAVGPTVHGGRQRRQRHSVRVDRAAAERRLAGVDPTTTGSMTSRVNGYLNPDAFESSGVGWGNLGRNTFVGPMQRRLDVNLSKLTRLRRRLVHRAAARGLQRHEHARRSAIPRAT